MVAVAQLSVSPLLLGFQVCHSCTGPSVMWNLLLSPPGICSYAMSSTSAFLGTTSHLLQYKQSQRQTPHSNHLDDGL